MTVYRSHPIRSLSSLLCLSLSLAGASTCFATDEEPRLSGKQIAPTSSAVDALLPTGGGTFNASAIASFDPNKKSFLRLESAWNLESDDALPNIRIGDSVSNPGSWGNAVRFAGVQFGTISEMRSDIVSSERMALAGVSVMPSSADALFAQIHDTALTQRGLSLKGKPAIGAGNGVTFTARDAAGQSATVTRPLVAKALSAEAGCKQHSISVGRARQNYALESNDYGPLYANTTVACGTNGGYTIEAHGDYLAGDAGRAGLGVSRAVGKLGTASVAVAGSRSDKDSGWLLRAGVQHTNEVFNVALRARMQSPEFRELGVAPAADPMIARVLASVGAMVNERHSLAIAYANQTTAADKRSDILSVSQVIKLGDRGSKGKISISADHAVKDDTNSSLLVSFMRSLR